MTPSTENHNKHQTLLSFFIREEEHRISSSVFMAVYVVYLQTYLFIEGAFDNTASRSITDALVDHGCDRLFEDGLTPTEQQVFGELS